MKYLVIDADIVNSRNYNITNENFNHRLDIINEEFKDIIACQFSMLKGDEIQGVLFSDVNIGRFLRKFRYHIRPYRVKIGIGYGEIYNHDWDSKTSWELNGEAFFKARDALDYIKKSNHSKQKIHYQTFFNSDNEILNETINLIISMIEDSIFKWKDDIWEITSMIEDGLKHDEIARYQNSLRSNISQKIRRSNWYKVKKAEEFIYHLISREDC